MKIKLIYLILCASIISSCTKYDNCQGDNENRGLIIEQLMPRCVPAGLAEGNNSFKVETQAEWENLFSTNNNCSLPQVDFEHHTVLGLYTESTGCQIKTIRDVQRKDNENRYHYKVSMISCGNCDMLAYSYNFVTVPKLPEGWNVTFEVE